MTARKEESRDQAPTTTAAAEISRTATSEGTPHRPVKICERVSRTPVIVTPFLQSFVFEASELSEVSQTGEWTLCTACPF